MGINNLPPMPEGFALAPNKALPPMPEGFTEQAVPQSLPEDSVASYADINTRGLPYPQRDIFDVLTGRGTTPTEKQESINQQYMNNMIGDNAGLESVTPFADFVNPLAMGAKVAGGVAGGYGVYKGGQALKNKIFPVGDEAVEVGKFRGLNPEQSEALTIGIPREDKALALAQGGKTDTVGVLSSAVKQGGDRARRALKIDSNKRLNLIEESIGTKSIDAVNKETSNMYSKMVKTVAKDNKASYDGSVLLDGLNQLEKLGARSDASERAVKVLKSKLDDNPNITLEQALDYRKDINYELRSAKGDHIKVWKGLKDNVDEFIAANTDPKMKEFIDDAVDTYATTKTNEELIGIVAKHKTPEGNAIDWEKAHEAIKAAGLNSEETNIAMDITKEFTQKFGNDSALSSLTKTQGTTNDGAGVLTLFSKAVKTIVGLGEKVLRTDAAINREVQSNILSSLIRKSKTESEFISSVAKNRYVAKDIRDRLAKHLKDTKKLHKTPVGKVATDVVNPKTRKILQKAQTDRNAKQNSMDKAQDAVDGFEDKIADTQSRIDKAIENGKATGNLRDRKAKLETRLDRAAKDLEIKTDRHSESASNYDTQLKDSGYEVDETGRFQAPTKPEARSNVAIPTKDLP